MIKSPERRTLTPNQWINFIDKDQTALDPLENILKGIIDAYPLLNILTIKELCESISETRNSMTHHDVLSLEKFLKLRPRFIENLNRLTSEVY